MLKHKVILLLLGAAFCLPAAGQKQNTTFVIVHGAWGGSWAFKKTDSIMTAHGHTVYRPSLTGQGERVHLATQDVDLSTHVNDVVNMILFEDLKDIVLVGHSYGGMVITGVANRVPDRIRKLIFLDAFVPNDGESVKSMQGAAFEGMLRMEKDGYLVPPWVKADQKPPMDVPHPVKTLTEPVAFDSPAAQKLPATYILTVDPGKKAEEDGFYQSSLRAKERGYEVLEMSADHNPQWSKVEELARLLEVNGEPK